jgi:serine/threonine-protein kinase RsbW
LAEIEVAVVETVNNCIEHASEGSETHKISIGFLLTDDRLAVEVQDNGKAIDTDYLQNLEAEFDFDPSDIANLPEGGMGLKIIKNCMDEVYYQNTDGQNRWLLTKFRCANTA